MFDQHQEFKATGYQTSIIAAIVVLTKKRSKTTNLGIIQTFLYESHAKNVIVLDSNTQ